MSAQDGGYNTIVCKQKQFPSSLLSGELWIYDKALLAVFQNLLLSDLLFLLLRDHLLDHWKGQSPFLSILDFADEISQQSDME